VQVTGDGFPLRIGDQTIEATESQIRALKFQGLVESFESRPSSLALADLDPALLARTRQGAGLEALSDEDYLLNRKLTDRRGSGLVLRQAAELLFAQQGPEHPNAGVRVFRVVGTERRLGAEHNVEERPRIEGNLPEVWQEALNVVGSLMRQPSRLVGNRFRPVSEYPRFSWQEALLNAIAHRDYRVQGAGSAADGRANIATWQRKPHQPLPPPIPNQEVRPQSCSYKPATWLSFAMPYDVACRTPP
jgi:ATP-dependent DNA helicase RecG